MAAAKSATKKKPAARKPARRAPEPHRLLIGTRKGGFVLEASRGRSGWKLSGPFVLGTQVHDLRMDPHRIPELLEESEDHPVWRRKADLCYSCGSCNLVCPTCYCFDVHEDFDWSLQTGERTRVWDGCMLTKFANVAGDHNFRGQKESRYRHRYYRKGLYVFDTIGQIACVGCGRCVGACLPDIANPVSVYNRLIDDMGIG